MTTLSWHQRRAAGLHQLPWDVVGYTTHGTIVCAQCGARPMTPVFRDQTDGTETCDLCGEGLA